LNIHPYFIGSGAAAKAMQKALYSAALLHSDWDLQTSQHLARGTFPTSLPQGINDKAVLFVASPHALHAPAIQQGVLSEFSAIVSEKPAGVHREDLALLRSLQTPIPIAVCHGYRAMWGMKTLRNLIRDQELGKIISVEGRYWQSSAAQRQGQLPTTNWKNDSTLSGNSDVLIDLASHWTDLLFFLAGEKCASASVWKSYVNAESAHRDTHVHVNMSFGTLGRTFGSISKTVHGMGNHLEIHLIGEKGRATWTFDKPDIITLGRGDSEQTLARKKDVAVGSQQAPFHGQGWLEGYVEIIEKTLLHLAGQATAEYPTLSQALDVMEALLTAETN